MARVLISESHVEVRRLLRRMVCELGHDPQVADAPPTVEDLEGVGLLIVEPADPRGALLAKTVQALVPGLPILCVSVLDSSQVDIAFHAFLCKPFTSEQFAETVERALAQERTGRGDRPAGGSHAVGNVCGLDFG
jgi:DNA-binding NtrC family response regulator